MSGREMIVVGDAEEGAGTRVPGRARRRAPLRALGLTVALATALAGTVAGTVVGTAATAAPAAAAVSGHDDMLYAFGSATYLGSPQHLPLASPIIAMAQTPKGGGYWFVADDGGVFGYNAPFYGSLSGFPLRLPVAAMAGTPDSRGYWLVTEDGGVFGFGSAKSYGNLVGVPLVAPITDIVATADGRGYWLVAEDGGVFSFGSARFFGSTGGMRLNAPVTAMAATPDGRGYWLMGRDGGVFSFGSARFFGSTGSMVLNAPVVGMARTATGRGYWLVAEDGGQFSFGDARFYGSAVGMLAPGRRVVQMVGMPKGDGYRMLALARTRDVALVGMGDRGAGVTDLQRRLEALGYWTGGANGVFGPLTQQAVWAFQKANGLGRSGVVDLPTRNAFRTARRPVPRSRTGYVIEVDKLRQLVIVARNGRAEIVFNTSTGTERPYIWKGNQYLADTPPGQWRITSQVDGVRDGELGTLFRPKYFHPDGIAFHGYSSVPPYPASHGCVRLTNAAINFVWGAGIMPLGTAVWVY